MLRNPHPKFVEMLAAEHFGIDVPFHCANGKFCIFQLLQTPPLAEKDITFLAL